MSDVFISYVEEDSSVAIEIAQGLEQAGYTTWYYQRDCLPGLAHLLQTNRAIEEAQAIVLIISENSVLSTEVDSEVDWTYHSRKRFIPVLIDVTWAEFEKRQPKWRRILGSAVGINATPRTVSGILPRLVAGLKAMEIAPQGELPISPTKPEVVNKIMNRYPSPLATTYAKVAGRVERERAFQFHQGLRDMTESIIKYLAVIALSQYRKDVTTAGKEDANVERNLQTLLQPVLEHWASLLHTALRGYVGTSEQLMSNLYEFYYQKGHDDDAVGEAVVKIQQWLQLEPQRRQAISYQDFFELLVLYRNRPEGWSAQGAVLASHVEYHKRVDILRPALEQTLIGLEFLASYHLIYVQNTGEQMGHARSHHLYQGLGGDIVVMTEPLKCQEALECGHLYICRKTAEELEPILDMHPLLICQECKNCHKLTTFFLNLVKEDRLEYVSYSCGHCLEFGKGSKQDRDLTDFLLLKRQAPPPPLPSPPYVKALQEVLVDGLITEDKRQKLDFLAEMMQIPRELAEQLETQVRTELEKKARLRQWYAEAEALLEQDAERALLRIGQIEQEEPAYPNLAVLRNRAEEMHKQQEKRKRLYALYAEAEKLVQQAPEQALDLISRLEEEEPRYPNLAELRTRAEQALVEVKPPPIVVQQDRFVFCWSELTASAVIGVALFGSPPMAYVADEKGNVSVYSNSRRLAYQEHVEGQPFRVAALRDKTLAGTWNGHLYCFGARELLWQTPLRSPISAIALSPGQIEIVAGTWDGQIAAFRSEDGQLLWQNRLDDGISSLSVTQAGDVIAAGSYAGHLCILDSAGSKIWLRDMQAAVVRVVFANLGRDVIIATRDGMMRRVNVENQEIMWGYAFEQPILDFSLSGNERRLVMASSEGQVLVCSLNGDITLRNEYAITELAQVLTLPFSADGRFVLGLSRRDGLAFLDNREKVLAVGTRQPANCAAISCDSCYALLGGSAAVYLYRLAKPDLRATLTPLDTLRQGHFTRLRISLHNVGESRARDIEMQLDGPVECKKLSLPGELEAGNTFSSEQQSLQPKNYGALPVNIRLQYVDDLGIQHENEDVQVLDVARE